jgi:cell division protein FtsB
MITFFDRYDLRTQYELRKELKELQQTKKYYEQEIKNNKEAITSLQKDTVALEKFAREKYLMKKNNEEIFLVYQNKTATKK